jgi:hypothetical protein
MPKALPKRNFARKSLTNTAHCSIKYKCKYFALVKKCNIQLSDLFASPQMQCFNASSKDKGDGTSVAVLHLYDSFHQKCSKLCPVTTLGLKNKGRE